MSRDELQCTWSLFAGSGGSKFCHEPEENRGPKRRLETRRDSPANGRQNGKATGHVFKPNLSSPKRTNNKRKMIEELSSPNALCKHRFNGWS